MYLPSMRTVRILRSRRGVLLPIASILSTITNHLRVRNPWFSRRARLKACSILISQMPKSTACPLKTRCRIPGLRTILILPPASLKSSRKRRIQPQGILWLKQLLRI